MPEQHSLERLHGRLLRQREEITSFRAASPIYVSRPPHPRTMSKMSTFQRLIPSAQREQRQTKHQDAGNHHRYTRPIGSKRPSDDRDKAEQQSQQTPGAKPRQRVVRSHYKSQWS